MDTMPKATKYSRNDVRLLMLDGDTGTVACRVYGKELAGTKPKLAKYARTIECATRSLLRCKNLIAVRGVPGRSMIGPCDYYFNLEKPQQNSYSLTITNSFPTLNTFENHVPQPPHNYPVYNEIFIECKWQSHNTQNYNKVGYSLFNRPGVLEINNDTIVFVDDALKNNSQSNATLKEYCVALVDNSEPFCVGDNTIDEDLRAVSYFFDKEYHLSQVSEETTDTSGGGIFLEYHEFPQIMTPLSSESDGYIILGRKIDNGLALISLNIPFGMTLIVYPGAIHGDATFCGKYLMAMTSEHTTMSTADTVFLKNPLTKNNVVPILLTSNPKQLDHNNNDFNDPIALFYKHKSTHKNFYNQVKKFSIITQPFSAAFWKTIYKKCYSYIR